MMKGVCCYFILLIISFVAGISAQATIGELAEEAGTFNTLLNILAEAGLANQLNDPGPFTIFAPTDAAFAEFEALGSILGNPQTSFQVLGRHLINGEVLLAEDLTSVASSENPTIDAITGASLNIALQDGNILIDGVPVIIADIVGSNGVIHAIGSVLMPPGDTPAGIPTDQPPLLDETLSIAEIVRTSGFSNLLAAVSAAGLVETLDTGGPFTLFAPTDRAFANLRFRSPGTLESLLSEEGTPTLTNILLYHVTEGEVLSEDIVSGSISELEMLQGETVTFSADPPAINGIDIVIPDVNAINGIVHGIDGVLLPSGIEIVPSIFKAAEETGEFKKLLEIIDGFDLRPQLNTAGPITLFAPIDSAFENFPALEAVIANQNLATQIFGYHFVDGLFRSNDLDSDTSLLSVLGDSLQVSIDGDKVMIGDAEVVIVDIVGSNGIVHGIDTVLVPTDVTLPEPIEDSPTTAMDDEVPSESKDIPSEDITDKTDSESDNSSSMSISALVALVCSSATTIIFLQ